MTVTVRNAPPVAVDDRITVRPDVATTLPLLANDHDPNTGQALRVSSVAAAGQGHRDAAPAARSPIAPARRDRHRHLHLRAHRRRGRHLDGHRHDHRSTGRRRRSATPPSTPWATAVDIRSRPTTPTRRATRSRSPAWAPRRTAVTTLNPDGTVALSAGARLRGHGHLRLQCAGPRRQHRRPALVTVLVSAVLPVARPDERITALRPGGDDLGAGERPGPAPVPRASRPSPSRLAAPSPSRTRRSPTRLRTTSPARPGSPTRRPTRRAAPPRRTSW